MTRWILLMAWAHLQDSAAVSCTRANVVYEHHLTPAQRNVRTFSTRPWWCLVRPLETTLQFLHTDPSPGASLVPGTSKPSLLSEIDVLYTVNVHPGPIALTVPWDCGILGNRAPRPALTGFSGPEESCHGPFTPYRCETEDSIKAKYELTLSSTTDNEVKTTEGERCRRGD
ncbi:hypothetical protein L218DRAFT_989175 [Marasmius fiardii PR-910]|nr:hypothetical protein L218DRAFT_989175 [Marasmius fiardii PR-910]